MDKKAVWGNDAMDISEIYSFIYGYLYSPKSMYSVTVNGQLYLLQLIERLSLAGIKCFYANTDGITCRVRKDQVELYYEICNKFAREVKISCEYQKYSKCIIRDCNNYLIVTSEGKLKKKGSFVTDTFDKDWEIALSRGIRRGVGLMDFSGWNTQRHSATNSYVGQI